MTHLLPSEILSLKYDAPHQRAKENEEYALEKDKYEYERCVAYFEREPTSYISSDERAYSNPISI